MNGVWDDGGYVPSPRIWIPACAGKTEVVGCGFCRHDVEPLPQTEEGTFKTPS